MSTTTLALPNDVRRATLERKAESALARLLDSVSVLERRKDRMVAYGHDVKTLAVPVGIGTSVVLLGLAGAAVVGLVRHRNDDRRIVVVVQGVRAPRRSYLKMAVMTLLGGMVLTLALARGRRVARRKLPSRTSSRKPGEE